MVEKDTASGVIADKCSFSGFLVVVGQLPKCFCHQVDKQLLLRGLQHTRRGILWESRIPSESVQIMILPMKLVSFWPGSLPTNPKQFRTFGGISWRAISSNLQAKAPGRCECRLPHAWRKVRELCQKHTVRCDVCSRHKSSLNRNASSQQFFPKWFNNVQPCSFDRKHGWKRNGRVQLAAQLFGAKQDPHPSGF